MTTIDPDASTTGHEDEGMEGGALRILELLDNPRELEALYRSDPGSFRAAFGEAFRSAPASLVLQAWQARLDAEGSPAGGAWKATLPRAVAIALAVGALIRLPAIRLGDEWYYTRLAPSLVLLGLCTYFWMEHRKRNHLLGGLGFAALAFAYALALPSQATDVGLHYADSVTMALLHLPLLMWVLLGVVFSGGAWQETGTRIRFLGYNGELLILASLVALGGLVFSGVTVALFELMAPDSGEWYVQNVGVFGAAAVPVAGTFLYDAVFGRRTGIAAVLARIFSPLFLVMVVVYLVFALATGQNPFIDRSFLITFNGLLLVVLGMTVFSIVERGEHAAMGPGDYVNLALLVVTLLIDAIALSAILFRVVSFGFTPNRVVVLGANLVIMIHLGWLCWTYVGWARRGGGQASMRGVVARYLPVYAVWAAVVAFLLPMVFGFE